MKFLKTVVWSIIKVSKKKHKDDKVAVFEGEFHTSSSIWYVHSVMGMTSIESIQPCHNQCIQPHYMLPSLLAASNWWKWAMKIAWVNAKHSKTTCHLGCRIIQGLHKLQCFTFGKASLYNVAMYWGGSLSTLISIISFVLEKSCIIEFLVFWTDFLFTTIQIKTLISTPTFSQHFQSQPKIFFLLPRYKFKSTMPTS